MTLLKHCHQRLRRTESLQEPLPFVSVRYVQDERCQRLRQDKQLFKTEEGLCRLKRPSVCEKLQQILLYQAIGRAHFLSLPRY